MEKDNPVAKEPTPMQPRKLVFNLARISLAEFEGNLEQTIAHLQGLMAEYSPHGFYSFSLAHEMEYEYGSELHEFILWGTRDETPQEVAKRLAKDEKSRVTKRERAKKRRQQKAEQEKALYEKLKKKYGD